VLQTELIPPIDLRVAHPARSSLLVLQCSCINVPNALGVAPPQRVAASVAQILHVVEVSNIAASFVSLRFFWSARISLALREKPVKNSSR